MRLFGTAEALRAQIGSPGRLIDRDAHARRHLDARLRSGESALTIARDDGHVMTLDEAIGYALEHHRPVSAGRAPSCGARPGRHVLYGK
jgi:hypothetical protein